MPWPGSVSATPHHLPTTFTPHGTISNGIDQPAQAPFRHLHNLRVQDSGNAYHQQPDSLQEHNDSHEIIDLNIPDTIDHSAIVPAAVATKNPTQSAETSNLPIAPAPVDFGHSAEHTESSGFTFEETQYLYANDIIPKMMFVSGETAEPSTETTWLIEEIVRDQVIHMVRIITIFLPYPPTNIFL